jgi:[ribosomal protein S5]-alanine N-acetyltransferase
MTGQQKINYRKIGLETERLVLKEIPFEYKEQLFSIFSDKEVMKYTDKAITENIDEAIVYLQNCHIRSDEKEHLFLGIFLKESADLIGMVSIYHIDMKHRFASLGILLAKDYWRQGFMTEAMKCFLNFCFNELNLHRLEAQTFVNNAASIKLFEKLKFHNEGRLRENFKIEGNFEDSYLFSMLKWEFVN